MVLKWINHKYDFILFPPNDSRPLRLWSRVCNVITSRLSRGHLANLPIVTFLVTAKPSFRYTPQQTNRPYNSTNCVYRIGQTSAYIIYAVVQCNEIIIVILWGLYVQAKFAP